MNTKSKKKNKGLILLVILITIILSLIQLTISHRLASAGEKVKQLELTALELEQKNITLEKEINQMGSLATVSSKAEALGLTKVQKVSFVASQVPVALGKVDYSSNRISIP